jgi:hypothetical protein
MAGIGVASGSSASWQRGSILITPAHGIEKFVRSEIFKEIWSEIDRLNHQSIVA